MIRHPDARMSRWPPHPDPASGSESAKSRQQIAGQDFERFYKFPQRRRSQYSAMGRMPRHGSGRATSAMAANRRKSPRNSRRAQIRFSQDRAVCRLAPEARFSSRIAPEVRKSTRGTACLPCPVEFSKMNHTHRSSCRSKFAVDGPKNGHADARTSWPRTQSGIRPGGQYRRKGLSPSGRTWVRPKRHTRVIVAVIPR